MQNDRAGRDRGGVAAALLILVLTAVLSLVWSSVKVLGNDEFLSFYSDSVPTAADVMRVQLHTPISLDPPTYHLLSHLSMELIGRNATALRLPTLLGFLLLQGALFLLVRRLAGHRAALVAMLLPMCTASFRYSVEGRPYGLLLGLYGAALLCWYCAASRSEKRLLPLVLLTLSIAGAITSHYFGVLLLVPLAAGELVRTLQRRRFDWAMVAALVAGAASVVLVLPFKRALAPYQQHYYTNAVNLRNVSQGYRELFVHYNGWPATLQTVTALLLALAFVAFCVAALRRFRNRPATEPAYLWAALLVCALLPFFGYLLGKFVTHTMEVRYVIAALIAFAVGIALLLERTLRSTGVFIAVVGAVLVAAVSINVAQIRQERDTTAALLSSLRITSQLHNELTANPDLRLNVQTLDDFFRDSYYAEDPLVRQRVTLLYDGDAEVSWLGHNTNAVTAQNMQAFTPLHMAEYPSALQPGALLITYGGNWEWVRRDLDRRATALQQQGDALGGKLWRIPAEPK